MNLTRFVKFINKFKVVTNNNIQTILDYLTTAILNFELVKKCCNIIDIFLYLDIDIQKICDYNKKVKNR